MDTFTCITEVRNSFHFSQHVASNPATALRLHISEFPYDDTGKIDDEEANWLLNICNGTSKLELALTHCTNTWLWRDGSKHRPQYITYIVKTDVENPS